MIPRQLEAELLRQLDEFPIVTVLGPRQAGKTTLVRQALPRFSYLSLEDPELRTIAHEDPKAFLAQHSSEGSGRGVILDEIQRAPHLLSHLQGIVDEQARNGVYVLTGSHQLQLREAVSQSLAGRTGILHLLPLSMTELAAAGRSAASFEDVTFRGFLPRVHDQDQRPHIAYGAYYQTYVERDVRQLIQLKDASLFEKFVKLLAGRVGQVLNLSSLGNDAGVDAKTVRHWLSILEASFVVFKLPPYFENFGKRVVKSPKYYFTDTGLLCFVLGIDRPEQITRDPLVGSIFENLVILEALKSRMNRGLLPNLSFFRDSNGNEIDLLLHSGRELLGFEIKSASTYHPSFKKGLLRFREKVTPLASATVVYNGEGRTFSDGVQLLRFSDVAGMV